MTHVDGERTGESETVHRVFTPTVTRPCAVGRMKGGRQKKRRREGRGGVLLKVSVAEKESDGSNDTCTLGRGWSRTELDHDD